VKLWAQDSLLAGLEDGLGTKGSSKLVVRARTSYKWAHVCGFSRTTAKAKAALSLALARFAKWAGGGLNRHVVVAAGALLHRVARLQGPRGARGEALRVLAGPLPRAAAGRKAVIFGSRAGTIPSAASTHCKGTGGKAAWRSDRPDQLRGHKRYCRWLEAA
jgi:hypothetical protein